MKKKNLKKKLENVKRKVEILYEDVDKNEKDDFELITALNFGDLLLIKIPEQEYLRSEYIHNCMKIIEEYYKKSEEDKKKENIFNLIQLRDYWKNYFLWNRMKLDQSEKLTFFCLRIRLNLIICQFVNEKVEELNTEKDDLSSEELKEFLIDKNKRILNYSVFSFWRTLYLFQRKFSEIRFQPIYERHFKRLYLCCGKFVTLTTRTNNIFNHPLYCIKNEQTGFYSINKIFMENCEMIFSSMEIKFQIFNYFIDKESYKTIREVKYPLEKKKCLLNWIFKSLTGSFLEPAENNIQKKLLELHVNREDKEKFIIENKASMADPSGYNILAKYKKDKFNEIVEIFQSESPFKFVLEIYNKFYDSKIEIPTQKVVSDKPNESDEESSKQQIDASSLDSDDVTLQKQKLIQSINENENKKYVSNFHTKSDLVLISISLCSLDFIFDEAFQTKVKFTSIFTIGTESIQKENELITLKKKLFQHKNPTFIQLFNEYFIYYKSNFIRCDDFLSAYLEWVHICSTEPEINCKPLPNINLISQYKILFPEKIENQEFITNKQNQNINSLKNKFGLPNNYNEDDPFYKTEINKINIFQ